MSQNILMHIPMAVIMVVGAYLGLSRWSRHPEVSLLAVIALGLFFLAAIEEAMRPSVAARLGPADVEELVRIMRLRGLANRTIMAVGVGILIWAALGWRNPAPKKRR